MKKLKEHKGAAAVEFALVLIPLILLVFGAVEFGVLLYNKQVITNASREGARAGIVYSSLNGVPLDRLPDKGVICAATYDPQNPQSIDCVVKHYVLNRMITFGAQNDPPETEVTGYNPKALFGQDLAVKVTYNYSFLVIPTFITGVNDLPISATTVMKFE